MKFGRFLVLITPVFIFSLFELFLVYQSRNFLYFAAILSCLLIFITTKFIVGRDFGSRFFNYSILPALFVLSSFFYFLFLHSKIFLQLVFFVNLIFLYFYFKNLFLLFNYAKFEKRDYFNNVFFYASFLVVFFFSSSFFGMLSLLGISVWPLIILVLPIFGMLAYNIIWINKINLRLGLLYILLVCVVFFELTWVLSFLPFNYNILGLILAIFYYMFSGLLKFHLKNILNSKLVKVYLSLGFLSIIIILLTAKWM